ncbi:MAG: methyltransferase domain-containing protein [Pseudonocardiaceae bacterium]
MINPADRLRRLADALTASGDLTDDWRPTFLSVPRHVFIPETIWRVTGKALVPFGRTDDPDGWLALAYGEEFVITQVDDGVPVGPGPAGRTISSSASRPNVVAYMLAALGAEPGMTVCEIGTGTGYNAALLAARLGADNVTTIEVDPELAIRARRALSAVGQDVAVVTGDGALGYPPRAPYDRVIATAAAQRVPYPWIEQTRPGGRVITPWGNAYHNGALLSLAVSDDGTAVGGIVGDMAFMWLRDQRVPGVSFDDARCDDGTAAVTYTDLHPYYVAGHYDASLAISLRVPGCANIHCPVDGHPEEYRVAFIDPTSDSWATVHYRPGADEYLVHQAGPRQLWDEVATAYQWWLDVGSPKADRWRITVTPHEQLIALAEPATLRVRTPSSVQLG